MEIAGQHRLNVSQEKVWEALNDPDILKASLPGCESLEKIGDTEMVAVMKAKVGPVSATFKGKVTLSDLDPPNSYKITGEGSGGMAGFAKGGAEVKLTKDEDGATILSYSASAQVGGKLAQIGARLIDSTARQMADEFFTRFAQNVGEDTSPPSSSSHEPPVAAQSEQVSSTASPDVAPVNINGSSQKQILIGVAAGIALVVFLILIQ